jgi:hypothetical protein
MTVLTETTARQWCRIPKVGFGTWLLEQVA